VSDTLPQVRFSEIAPMKEFSIGDGYWWVKMPGEYQEPDGGGYACVQWDDKRYMGASEMVHPRRLDSLRPEALLRILSWKPDMVVTNHDGHRVWLKESLDSTGKRDGITDCCFVDDPCERHKRTLTSSVEVGGEREDANQ
jgi:hypothetical protein